MLTELEQEVDGALGVAGSLDESRGAGLQHRRPAGQIAGVRREGLGRCAEMKAELRGCDFGDQLLERVRLASSIRGSFFESQT